MSPAIEKRYDRVNAGTLVTAARAVYGDREMINGWAAGLGCEDCEVIEDAGTDTRVMAASGEGFVIVCFQGTADLRNWITDLDCELVNERISESVSGAKIHAGFQQALKSVIPELRETLTRLALERRDVYFTGHSLGGALAMLAAARMQNEEWRMQNENSSRPIPNSPGIWLYTFGQPRVGNGAWARWYDGRLKERSWRIVHAEDIVPRVPWLLRMFRHAGHEVFYPGLTDRTDRTDRTNRWRMDVPWWRKAPGDVFGTWAEWRRKGRIALLADHRVETYVKLLNP